MIKFPNKKTPILYQGITASSGAIHVEKAIFYGSNVVAGVSKDKSVTMFQNVPVFQTVKEAVRKTKPQISVIFSSPQRVLQDVEEAAKAKIPLIICPTNHVPYKDALLMKQLALKYKVQLIGPSAPGLVTVDQSVAGTVPAHLFTKGNVGIISRSSSLTYETVQQLAKFELGVSSCAAIGSAAIIGTGFIPVIEAFLKDAKTKAILIIGKSSGEFEYELAEFLKKKKTHKKIALYIPGRFLKKGETEISDKKNDILSKEKALEKVGVHIIRSASEIGREMSDLMHVKEEKK
jgi:succinyl-CoA synthetase alpha subunit